MVVRENFSPGLRPCSTLIFKVFLGLDYVFGAAWRRGTKETCQQSDFVEEVWSTPPCKLRWTVKVGKKKVARIPHGLRLDLRRLGKPRDLTVRRPVKEQTAVYRGPLGLQGQESESTVAQFSSVAQSCPTLCDPVNRSMPGLPVHHQLLEFTQTHAH